MQTRVHRKFLRESVATIAACILLFGCGPDHGEQSREPGEGSVACVNGGDPACNKPGNVLLPAAASDSGLASAAVRQLFEEDTHRNVGKALPGGIRVIDRGGDPVDLKAALLALNSPTILVRVEPGCSPCDDLLDYVQANAPRYSARDEARLVVIEVLGSGGRSFRHEPSSEIPLFKSEGKLDTGFLAGHISPAVFFFDKNQKLIARRAGLTTPEDFLHFPEMMEAGN